jgi:hypothetical protein
MAEYLCLEEDVVVGGELVCTNRTDRNPNVSWGNHTNLSVVFGEELDIVFVRSIVFTHNLPAGQKSFRTTPPIAKPVDF